MKNILITGGAGFIGSNLSRQLEKAGYDITILDNLSPQIHGEVFQYEPSENINFINGNVRNRNDWKIALRNIDTIVHLAAETGTGQSMYEVYRYVDNNINGTAIMLDYLVKGLHKISKVIIASSRAVYGEGKYQCEEHGICYPEGRRGNDLAKGNFEPVCPKCCKNLQMLPTDEESKVHPASVYGITKFSQEQMVLNVCRSLNIPAIAFRYQNVYGPGQSLKNPYTGLLSIFSTQIRNGKNLNVFEDGLESRDFVYIDDVVNATILGIESTIDEQEIFNVGSGISTTVIDVAKNLINLFQANVDIAVSGNYRIGDIRHNIADLTKIRRELGFNPAFSFTEGIKKFIDWVLNQEISVGRYEESIREMKSRGLLK